MFGKRREEKLLEQIADVNEDLQRKLSKSERTLKDINTFLSFLSESVCKGKQICGIKKIRRYDQDVYVGYILEHKFEIEPQKTYVYTIYGYISTNVSSPIYKAELNWQFSRLETDIVKRLELANNYVCGKDMYGIGIGSAGLDVIKELARELNCSEIYGSRRPLDGKENEERLYQFYEKNGFEQRHDSDLIRYDFAKETTRKS